MPKGSAANVKVECDNLNCKTPILNMMRWVDYNKYLKEGNIFYCQVCSNKLYGRKKASETILQSKKINREGESNINRFGCKMTIIEYINEKNIIIIFDNGHIKKCTYGMFKDGDVRNPTNLGLGNSYMGVGKYNSVNYEIAYYTWRNMLQRCYNKNNQKQRPTYIDCTVCEEWLDFQKFAKWYEENYYELNNEKTHLDKDILFKGNNIYSPETCIFVPSKINILFTKHQNSRGIYPIGVSLQRYNGRYNASCSDGATQKKIGTYDTPEEAFNAYKIYKENIIKQIADEYKDKISQKLYDALYKYEVEITD